MTRCRRRCARRRRPHEPVARARSARRAVRGPGRARLAPLPTPEDDRSRGPRRTARSSSRATPTRPTSSATAVPPTTRRCSTTAPTGRSTLASSSLPAVRRRVAVPRVHRRRDGHPLRRSTGASSRRTGWAGRSSTRIDMVALRQLAARPLPPAGRPRLGLPRRGDPRGCRPESRVPRLRRLPVGRPAPDRARRARRSSTSTSAGSAGARSSRPKATRSPSCPAR